VLNAQIKPREFWSTRTRLVLVFVSVNTPDPSIPAVKLALVFPQALTESVSRVIGLKLAELKPP
jgi:hypothetical protein